MYTRRPGSSPTLILLLAFILAACTAGGGLPTPHAVALVPTETNTPPATRVLPTLMATTTRPALPTATIPSPDTPGPSPTPTTFATRTPIPTLRPLPTNTPFPTRTPRPTATSGPPPPAPAPTATSVPTGWSGTYYPTRDLSGQPALTRADAELSFNWGTGAPGSGLPVDGFSARWQRTASFESGVFRFNAIADDGVRVWLDGQLIIDRWHDATGATYTTERALTAGAHALKVEYYENLGDARLQVWWEKADTVTHWSGHYFGNKELGGAPVLTRNEPVLGFNWGAAAPGTGVPADGFSARWTRTLQFDGGTYRFYALADDGIRLFVDDQAVIHEWHETGNKTYVVDRAIAAGTHTLRVEYYENLGDAFASVWWERLDESGYWLAEFYANAELSGRPSRLRHDRLVDFSWGDGVAADGLPADNFSVRWLGTGVFEPARYRFHVLVDDGARLWVNHTLIVDEWRDGTQREIVVDRDIQPGTFPVRVEYYDRAGGARIRVWWEMLTALQRH